MNVSFTPDIDIKQFQYDLKNRILLSPMQSLPELIVNLVLEQFDKQLRRLVDCGVILRYKIGYNSREKISPMIKGSPDLHLPSGRWPPKPGVIQLPWFLKNLPSEAVIELGWFGFTIVCMKNNFRSIHFIEPVNLICAKSLEVQEKPQKTVIHYIVRMGYWEPVSLPVEILAPIRDVLVPSCECHPDYLSAYISGVWDWTIRFVCKICGKSYYCECFRSALEKLYMKSLEEKEHYSESGWPHKFISAYEKSQFREGICHLCRDIPSEVFYCHPMYGSKVKVHYGPYIKKIAVEEDIDEREAENEIRDILGIPHIGEGWVSERELLNMVKDIFHSNDVVHQASPEWLGRQRLDIYITDLQLAIEYQGRQHYEPVPFFGGEEGFRQTRERDRLKSKLCTENGVDLVFFRYDEIITKDLVESRIRGVLKSKSIS
jgi:hypothetical protein